MAYPDRGAGNDLKLFFFFFFLRGVGVGEGEGGLNIFYSGQYGSNDLPRPRRSVLSECF